MCIFALREADRLPVIILGGMMAGAFLAIIHKTRLDQLYIRTRTESTASCAHPLRGFCGIDDLGVPFSATSDAEDFGSPVHNLRPMVLVSRDAPIKMPKWS